jgi:hypothetical protein
MKNAIKGKVDIEKDSPKAYKKRSHVVSCVFGITSVVMFIFFAARQLTVSAYPQYQRTIHQV